QVFDGHVRNRIRIYFSRRFKLLEYPRPISSVPVDQFHERGAVFESAVDSLPEEGNNRMCRIAQHQNLAFRLPRRALNGDHRSRWIAEIIVGKLWHQRECIGKSRLEKLKH